MTPLIGLWHDGAFWLCTGSHEQKARKLATDPRVAETTGTDVRELTVPARHSGR